MNKFVVVFAALALAVFAAKVDLKKSQDLTKKVMDSISSSGKIRSVILNPATLPCGYAIDSNVETNITSGGEVQRMVYTQTLARMKQIMSNAVTVTVPMKEYMFNVLRYDLGFQKQGQKYVPAADATTIPLISYECQNLEYTIEDADAKVAEHFKLFTTPTTFDSMTTKVIGGKKYFVYIVDVKSGGDNTHAEVTVNDQMYIVNLNVTDVGKEVTSSFTSYKYRFNYQLSEFAVDSNRYINCKDEFFVAPTKNPCN